MYRIPGVVSSATAAPAPAVPQVQPTRGPPPGSPQALDDGNAAGPAKAILDLVEDHERIALGLNDVVVRRLFTAGLDLQAALGLMGDHPASGKICHAVDELDQAIRDRESGTPSSITKQVIDRIGSTSTSTIPNPSTTSFRPGPDRWTITSCALGAPVAVLDGTGAGIRRSVHRESSVN